MKITRRAFVGISLASLGVNPFAISSETEPVLFTVRLSLGNYESKSDLTAIFRLLSEIGFHGVELSGDYVSRAEEIKESLGETGLVCAAVRVPLSDLLGARFEEVVQSNRVFQNQNLIVSDGLARPFRRKGGNRFTSYFFNRLACKAGYAGLRVGIASQPALFAQIEEERTAWDFFFRQADPRVIAELDLKTCMDCNTDPSMVIQGTAERVALVSISDDFLPEEGEMPLDRSRLLNLCKTIGKTRYFVLNLETNDGCLPSPEEIAGRLGRTKEIMRCL